MYWMMLAFPLPPTSHSPHAMHCMQAGVPMLVMLATNAENLRKPSSEMWEIMCRDHNGGVQPGEADVVMCGGCGAVQGGAGGGGGDKRAISRWLRLHLYMLR